MFTKSALTAAALLIAVPAFASNADQLALGLGVAPAAYSLNELVLLKSAQDDGDVTRAAFVGTQSGTEVTSRATPFGLDVPATLTLNDRILLNEALQDSENTIASAILTGATKNSGTSDRAIVTPAKAQLAAQLGVNPADYTSAELGVMYLGAQNTANEGSN